MIGYKGYDENLKCRDFQYEINKEYKEKTKPKCCLNGFHFCEYPLDVFKYYEPTKSRYTVVEALGDIDKGDDKNDSKEDNKKSAHKEKNSSVASNTGYSSVASNIGYRSVASNTGDRSVASNTGDRSVASNIGYSSVASNTGEKGIASSLGVNGRAKGVIGTWLVLAEWVIKDNQDYEVKQVKTIKVDGKKIKENTLYQLIDGKFVEVKENE